MQTGDSDCGPEGRGSSPLGHPRPLGQALFRHCRSRWSTALTGPATLIRPDHDSAAPGPSGQALQGLCEQGPARRSEQGETGPSVGLHVLPPTSEVPCDSACPPSS
jgi:hypothetical protein